MRQRRGLADFESHERQDFDQRMKATQSKLEECDASIEEAHEEIRCEIADME